MLLSATSGEGDVERVADDDRKEFDAGVEAGEDEDGVLSSQTSLLEK